MKEGHVKLQRVKRHKRVRAKVSGTTMMPRLSVFRSSSHISAQIIDDIGGSTLLAVNDMNLKRSELSGVPKELSAKGKIAFVLGKKLGAAAREKGIGRIVFDRGGFAYHGRLKAFAEGARAGGLTF